MTQSKTRLTWTKEMEVRLEELYSEKNLEAKAVARVLNEEFPECGAPVDENKVWYKAQDLGLKRRREPNVHTINLFSRRRAPYSGPIVNLRDTENSRKARKLEKERLASGNLLSLTELSNRTCRWPIDDPARDEHVFCGQLVMAGRRSGGQNHVYCEEHHEVAYKPAHEIEPFRNVNYRIRR